MEKKSGNGIMRIAQSMVSVGVFIVLFFIYSGISGVKNDMTTLKTSQDTIKTEIKMIRKNDSTFKSIILPIVKNNTELISKNLK